MKNILNVMQNRLKINVNSIKYYDGGVSNENFLINNKYIFRRKKSFAQPFYNSKCEKNIEEFLKGKGITAPLVSIYDDGTKITEFLEDTKDLSSQVIDDELLVKIANKIREIHSYKYKAIKDFDPFGRLDYYLESNPNPKRELNNYIISKMKKYYTNTEMVMCHNDLVPGNILVDSNKEIKVIDFEYASNNHPFFDVISFLSENNITDKHQIDLFISTYYQNNLPENIEEMTNDFFNFLDLIWYNWSVMMYFNLHEPIYYEICKIKDARLKQIDITKKGF